LFGQDGDLLTTRRYLTIPGVACSEGLFPEKPCLMRVLGLYAAAKLASQKG